MEEITTRVLLSTHCGHPTNARTSNALLFGFITLISYIDINIYIYVYILYITSPVEAAAVMFM